MTTGPTLLSPNYQTAKQPPVLKLLDGDPFLHRMRAASDALARRAFQLFERRGGQHGRDLEDWLRAESELLNPMPLEIKDDGSQLIVRADVPGLRDKDIEVRVAPHCLVISGERERVRETKRRASFYGEKDTDEVLRVLDFPEEINTSAVKATLRNGTLEVLMPKARPDRNLPVAMKAA
ncbi:MAG: Hsp20 family protein [Terriglobales bacterium]|jgi:HSP20 family protein